MKIDDVCRLSKTLSAAQSARKTSAFILQICTFLTAETFLTNTLKTCSVKQYKNPSLSFFVPNCFWKLLWGDSDAPLNSFRWCIFYIKTHCQRLYCFHTPLFSIPLVSTKKIKLMLTVHRISSSILFWELQLFFVFVRCWQKVFFSMTI